MDLSSSWTTIHGSPVSGPPGCRLVLTCGDTVKEEVHSVGKMRFGYMVLSDVFHSAWEQSPTTAIDSFFGWQIFVGDCHSAAVVDDGTLAILFEDPAGDCAGDPELQCYLPIPGWVDGNPPLSSGRHTYELLWTSTEVTLVIDDGLSQVTASEQNCGFPPPALPMNIVINCNLDGQIFQDHTLEVDVIEVFGCQDPFAAGSILLDTFETGTTDVCWTQVQQ